MMRMRSFGALVSPAGRLLCAMVCLLLAGCGEGAGQAGSESDAPLSAQSVEQAASDALSASYCFETAGVLLYPDMDVTRLPEALGEPEGTLEQESCAAQGTAYLYTFRDFELATYPDGEMDRIHYILLKTDNVSTREGADLSADRAEIERIYGVPNERSADADVYHKGAMRLIVAYDGDGFVKAIEYRSDIMQ